jgi:hypothetical protein
MNYSRQEANKVIKNMETALARPGYNLLGARYDESLKRIRAFYAKEGDTEFIYSILYMKAIDGQPLANNKTIFKQAPRVFYKLLDMTRIPDFVITRHEERFAPFYTDLEFFTWLNVHTLQMDRAEKGLPLELPDRGPMTPERVKEIFDEAMKNPVRPEIIIPKTCSLSFPEWQQRERRRMAEEKAGVKGSPGRLNKDFKHGG